MRKFVTLRVVFMAFINEVLVFFFDFLKSKTEFEDIAVFITLLYFCFVLVMLWTLTSEQFLKLWYLFYLVYVLVFIVVVALFVIKNVLPLVIFLQEIIFINIEIAPLFVKNYPDSYYISVLKTTFVLLQLYYFLLLTIAAFSCEYLRLFTSKKYDY